MKSQLRFHWPSYRNSEFAPGDSFAGTGPIKYMRSVEEKANNRPDKNGLTLRIEWIGESVFNS